LARGAANDNIDISILLEIKVLYVSTKYSITPKILIQGKACMLIVLNKSNMFETSEFKSLCKTTRTSK